MAEQAADRVAFLLSLVPWLMDRAQVSVAEAAVHFAVPDQQIRDAVRLIAVSGIPGETNQYQHGDLFDIAWDRFEENDEIVLTNLVAIDDTPRFSGREAAALIAGLQYLSALPENADRGAIDSLMAKLARGSSASPNQVGVERSATNQSLTLIRAAVSSEVQVEFDYVNARGEHEHRCVDPLRIESVDSSWYLRGWCHLRQAVRTFRLDRISTLERTTQPILHRAGDIELPEKLFEGSADDLLVTVDVSSAAASLIADYLAVGEPESVSGDRRRVIIHVSDHHSLKRLVSGLPGAVVVIAPADARAAVAEWADSGAARYRV